MRKTLVSAITTTLVVGAASTAFAASNPFTDVPADSWAYDAVATLSADGVIDGYPDGSYKGQNTMTRYEMAQIVARAMAKTDVSKADKALVDKLAAEFADELDNLGVRVADLEKKSDNVKWNGELRYRYYDVDDDEKGDSKYNKIMFRLEPKAYIGNTGWTANARIGYLMDASSDSNASYDDDDNDGAVDRIYVQGPLFGGNVTAGKFGLFTDQGLVLDDRVTGLQYDFGSKVFNTKISAARYDNDPSDHKFRDNSAEAVGTRDLTADLYNIEFNYSPSDKTNINLGYLLLNGMDGVLQDDHGNYTDFHDYIKANDSDEMQIWYLGGNFAFNNNLALSAQYANNTEADDEDTAWTAELQYKGADPKDAGSWGAYAGYRYIEEYSVPAPTYDDIIGAGYKGYVVGASWVPAENIMATLRWFDGETTVHGEDASKFFGEVEFFF